MESLTPRQTQILKHVVEEYLETAEPVGSDNLDRKHNIGVSPATIRNEMGVLTHFGYLRQPHTSSGRVPSPKAMKFYVAQLMDEKKMSVAEEVSAKQEFLNSRESFDKLMHTATRALAQSTHALSVAVTEDGEVWHAGYANILSSPEFYNIDVTTNVLSLLEEAKRLHELFFELLEGNDPLELCFGEETGWRNFEPVGIIASRFQTPHTRGSLAVIGPTRLNYPVIIPVVRYYSELVSQSAT